MNVYSVLSNLSVPVRRLTFSGSETTYITFFDYNENEAQSADDEETATYEFVQVDVWSKGDYTQLVKDVKTAMKAAGFKRRDEQEFYEDDTELFHKAIRFVINT
ncbi:hypothetical protein D7Z54_14555 [Salibacterium salarium]|uniref:Uncharacterized protein n=1 Tax=Salibacterium salarium TaxID=284579 RepID=A0A3R9P725_9BACI|nr:hypothetical protein [Salibacterium salarium]RSL32667.1 hypothetical protein D7Z54_14555 [Salibacterium salarium]